jgi:hypothetical protein
VKGGTTVIAFAKDPSGYSWELIERQKPTQEPLCQVRETQDGKELLLLGCAGSCTLRAVLWWRPSCSRATQGTRSFTQFLLPTQ